MSMKLQNAINILHLNGHVWQWVQDRSAQIYRITAFKVSYKVGKVKCYDQMSHLLWIRRGDRSTCVILVSINHRGTSPRIPVASCH